jgi:riboflavin kinase / FMN adenylyltransferase
LDEADPDGNYTRPCMSPSRLEVVRGLDAAPKRPGPTVVTVGVFDGVHRGHSMLFGRVREEAKSLGARPGVVTFDPHPLEVLRPDKAPCVLTTLDQRLELFEREGLEIALVLPFTKELAALDPIEFGKAALVEDLHVVKILVGEDFRFGHGRAGDINTLKQLGQEFGFEAEAIGLLGNESHKISSSDIRLMISEGRVEDAAGLLGRNYALGGIVVEGDKRGRALGFPTANIKPHPRACLSGLGVYAGWWVWKGERYPGAINVGVRPTFKTSDPPQCEIYVLDFDEDLYGQYGEVEFTAFLRPEEKFASASELIEQMRADVGRSRALLQV